MAKAKKKVSGNILLTITGVVKEAIRSEKSDSIKHTIGYATETVDEETVWQNWQFFTTPYGDNEAQEYPTGTVIQLTFKYFGTFQAQNGSWYYTPVYPDVKVVKWGASEQSDASPQPTHDNKKSTNKPDATPEPVLDDEDF